MNAVLLVPQSLHLLPRAHTPLSFRETVLTAPSVMPMLYRMSRESLPALIPDPGGLDQTYTYGMPALERGQKTCGQLGRVLGSDSCVRILAMSTLGNFKEKLGYSSNTQSTPESKLTLGG